ncbi:Laminin subunit gamma-1 [Triplophysa tibetana]|uniref:Laminin subunit gamma-1 n=1 Tax=Triplophysa tibetana TaxID=1572043 RepID=A0A5A9PEH3_9TELE|nr:Laminin subunit gamma-1 [Triplophysa tibetana]
MDECTDELNRPQRCMPEFVNAAFNVTVVATNTCGTPPEEYCVQTGATGVTKSCHICDAGDPELHHDATFLTDYNNQADTTWWQSQNMLAGIQYPRSINLTLHLGNYEMPQGDLSSNYRCGLCVYECVNVVTEDGKMQRGSLKYQPAQQREGYMRRRSTSGAVYAAVSCLASMFYPASPDQAL